MADIQRYVAQVGSLPSRQIIGDSDYAGWVDVVLYADHLAAVAEAEQRAFDAGYQHQREVVDMLLHSPGYEQGQRDEREKWIAECELIAKTDDGSATAKRAMEYLLDTLAVIDGEASE